MTNPPPPPGPAASEEGEIAPWQKLAADLLVWYLAIHVFVVAVMAVAPILAAIPETSPVGLAYFDILSLDLGWAALVAIPAILAAVTFTAMWNERMGKWRSKVLVLSIGGIVISITLYAVLIWFGFGKDLWQEYGPPDYSAFKSACRSFCGESILFFFAVILGVIGVNVRDLFKGNSRS